MHFTLVTIVKVNDSAGNIMSGVRLPAVAANSMNGRHITNNKIIPTMNMHSAFSVLFGML